MKNRRPLTERANFTVLAIASALFLLLLPGPRFQPEATARVALAGSQLPDICTELAPCVEFSLVPTGPTCCWKLNVTLKEGPYCPSSLPFQNLTLLVGVPFQFIQVNPAPGWTLSGAIPGSGPITLTPPGPLSMGTTTIGRVCVNSFNFNPGTLTVQVTVQNVTCTTSQSFRCPDGCLICGRKCRDLNGNGSCDHNEPLLSNWPITLTDTLGNSVTIKTDARGDFCFFNIAPGNYTISETIPSDWVAGEVSCTKFIPVEVPGYPKAVDCGQQAGACQFTCEFLEAINRYDCIMCRFPNMRAEDVAEKKECDDRPEILNTGWDQRISSAIPLSDPDDEWVIIQDPDPNTPEPRPATVIANPGTKKEPQSEWISADQLGRVRRTGQYVFQRCFCLDPDDLPKASMSLKLWAADEAIVFLNGNQIGVTPPQSYAQPNPLMITTSAGFRAGLNCLQVVVTGGPTGFPLRPQAGLNLVGDVTAGGDLCCEGGAICGVKFHDRNGDGQMDSNEPLLTGWTIVLRDNQGTVVRTAITDQNGAYCFNRLPPGQYEVSEILQPNWRQTTPPRPGIHRVDLQPKQSVLHRDFGNRQ